jgi:hypothetical protein
MDLNKFLIAFMGSLVVLTMVGLVDIRRQSGRPRARFNWIMLVWLWFLFATGVVAAQELNERAYNPIEVAIMIFGAGLLVMLTALITYIWWQLRGE